MTDNNEEPRTWMTDTDGKEQISVSEYNIAVNANDFNSITIASYMDSGAIKLPFFSAPFHMGAYSRIASYRIAHPWSPRSSNISLREIKK